VHSLLTLTHYTASIYFIFPSIKSSQHKKKHIETSSLNNNK